MNAFLFSFNSICFFFLSWQNLFELFFISFLEIQNFQISTTNTHETSMNFFFFLREGRTYVSMWSMLLFCWCCIVVLDCYISIELLIFFLGIWFLCVWVNLYFLFVWISLACWNSYLILLITIRFNMPTSVFICTRTRAIKKKMIQRTTQEEIYFIYVTVRKSMFRQHQCVNLRVYFFIVKISLEKCVYLLPIAK